MLKERIRGEVTKSEPIRKRLMAEEEPIGRLKVTIHDIQTEADLAYATRLERHVWHEALKHHLSYHDLFYATLTVAAKYHGFHEEELFYSSQVCHANIENEHLWHEAYWCAIFEKKARGVKWPYHNPMSPDDPKNIDR